MPVSLVPAPTHSTWPSVVGGRCSARARCSDGGFGAREAERPKADVMALARAVVDRLLEADVLAAAVKVGVPNGAVG